MNTAQLREAARNAEQATDWALAAKLWQQAADAYPNRKGALARLDISKLEARARACQGSADFLAAEDEAWASVPRDPTGRYC